MLVRRRPLCTMTGLLLAAAVGVSVASAARPSGKPGATRAERQTRARYEQVKKGMTRRQVERIVAEPPGDYSRGRSWPRPRPSAVYDLDYESWLGTDAELLVRFDDGRAGDVRVCAVLTLPPPPTIWGRLRASLGL